MMNLVRNVLTPRLADAGSESRIAVSARPWRERSKQIDDGADHDRDRKRHQIEDGIAAAAVGRDLPQDRRCQRQAGAGAEHRDQACRERKDLGHDPGADGEIGAAQAEHRERDREWRSGRRTARQSPAPDRRSCPARRSDRTAHSRRARHRPAGRPRRGRHSRRADSTAAPARGNRPFRRRAASSRHRSTMARRRARPAPAPRPRRRRDWLSLPARRERSSITSPSCAETARSGGRSG